MIEFLGSNADVLAVRITGKLLHGELQTLADHLERSLAERDKTHLFAELVDYEGFAWRDLGDYFPRALKILG